MKKKEIDDAIRQYECACNLIMAAFNDRFYNCKRDPMWVGDVIGGLADFGYIDFISTDDMVYALKSGATGEDMDAYFESIANGDNVAIDAFLINRGVANKMI